VEYPSIAEGPRSISFRSGSWFLVCYATTQLAIQVHQERIQVMRSNKEAWKRPTESNGTSTMDIGFEDIHIRRYTNKRKITEHTSVNKVFESKKFMFINYMEFPHFVLS